MSDQQQTNGNGHIKAPEFELKVGLLNDENHYLTATKFGTVNANGKSFTRQQLWTLEQVSGQPTDDIIRIRSFKGQYLFLNCDNKEGEVRVCEEDEVESKDKYAMFKVDYPDTNQSQFQGCWFFKCLGDDTYLENSAGGSTVKCFANKPLERTIGWTVQLSLHPQLNIMSVKRKCFAHLKDDELQFNEEVPWGSDALVILEFKDGWYSLKTCDNSYLKNDGTLEKEITEDSKYNLEIKLSKDAATNGIAFKDKNNTYMSAIGAKATMKAGKANKACTSDNLFKLQDSNPQVVITTTSDPTKRRNVSIKQGKATPCMPLFFGCVFNGYG